MSTIVSEATHASRVRYLRRRHACGHTAEVKVSPTISAAYVREIRREAKAACARFAGRRRARRQLTQDSHAIIPCTLLPLGCFLPQDS